MEFNVLFSTNMAISKTEGELSLPSETRPASTLAASLFSSHPKRERDREAHLNYYASAYNRGRQLSHRKTKLNQIQQKRSCILNRHRKKKLKPGYIASYNIRPASILVDWVG